jgi:UDP-N-acetylmuramoyl-L-alanyl-D-glutamate--2,6-diaminopimelate ligase
MKSGADAAGGVEGKNYFRIADRRAAIRMAVHLARAGDVLLVLGKGHEQSMCFGEIEYAWDDRVALKSAIADQLGIPGPSMPFLPS